MDRSLALRYAAPAPSARTDSGSSAAMRSRSALRVSSRSAMSS